MFKYIQSNATAVPGILKSKDVYYEDCADTSSACSTNTQCKTKYRDVIY